MSRLRQQWALWPCGAVLIRLAIIGFQLCKSCKLPSVFWMVSLVMMAICTVLHMAMLSVLILNRRSLVLHEQVPTELEKLKMHAGSRPEPLLY